VTAFVFVFGLVITLVAGGAVATIWWAALEDGEVDRDLEHARPGDFSAEPAPVPAASTAGG
jgi:hypothetical protein